MAAVVVAKNEVGTLPAVLSELERIPGLQTCVVVNGSNDGTFHAARLSTSGIVVHFPESLGHDVGRAVGARLADADVVLFMDGDFPVAAEQLTPFIRAAARGVDVALNDISPFLGKFSGWDSVSIVKQFLNSSLGRGDLRANSMTAVPHALTRRAIETIGMRQLAVPPLAQAIAIKSGLRVAAPHSVDVIRLNRLRSGNTGGNNPVAEMIVGDHLEALKAQFDHSGHRLAYADTMRDRQAAGGGR